jgi:hypothetical protein
MVIDVPTDDSDTVRTIGKYDDSEIFESGDTE